MHRPLAQFMHLATFLLIGCASALTATKKEHQGVLDAVHDAVKGGDVDRDGVMNGEEFANELSSSNDFHKWEVNALDGDHDGKVNGEPFEALEDKMKEIKMQNKMKKALEKVQAVKDNKRLQNKMKKALEKVQAVKDKKRLNDAMPKEEVKLFDRDGDGFKDAEQFEALEKTLPLPEKRVAAPLKEFGTAISYADKDGDRKMNFKEFKAQMLVDEAFRKAVKDEQPLNANAMPKEEFKHMFQSLDRDGDGFLDAEPFEALENMPSLEKGVAAPPNKVSKAVAYADKDGDRKMNFKEFKAQMLESAALRKEPSALEVKHFPEFQDDIFETEEDRTTGNLLGALKCIKNSELYKSAEDKEQYLETVNDQIFNVQSLASELKEFGDVQAKAEAANTAFSTNSEKMKLQFKLLTKWGAEGNHKKLLAAKGEADQAVQDAKEVDNKLQQVLLSMGPTAVQCMKDNHYALP